MRSRQLQRNQLLIHRPSCGIGLPGFFCSQVPANVEDDPAELDEVWRRGGAGGYTAGACFVFRVHGILVNGEKHRFAEGAAVPAGATAVRKDQFSVSPGSIEYLSVTFDLEQLMQALGQFLDAVGYTSALHAALCRVRDHLAEQHAAKHRPPAVPAQDTHL